METSAVKFSDSELKRVIFTAALMSSIDRDVDEKEWEVIQSFGESHWKEEYGDFADYQKSILVEISELLKDETSLYEKVESLIADFNSLYSPEQKSVVVGLLGYVIEADDVLASDESNLFGTFLGRLNTL